MYLVYSLFSLLFIILVISLVGLFRVNASMERKFLEARKTCHSAVEAALVLPTITREWTLFNGFVRYVEGREEEIAMAVFSRKCSRAKAIELFDVIHSMLIELLVIRSRLQVDASAPADKSQLLLKQIQQDMLRIEHCETETKNRAKQLGSIKSAVLDVERRLSENSSDLVYDFMILEISRIHLRYFDLMTCDL